MSSVLCMSFSVTYHLFISMCPCSGTLLKLDFSGIIIVIYGSGVVSYFYGFYCDTKYMVFYIILCTIVSSLVFMTLMSEKMGTSKSVIITVLLYASLVIVLMIPAFHLVYRRYAYCYLFTFLSYFVAPDNSYIEVYVPLFALGKSFLFFLMGFSFYLMYYPESKYPKTYDYIVRR